jgi:hypothetical protein
MRLCGHTFTIQQDGEPLEEALEEEKEEEEEKDDDDDDSSLNLEVSSMFGKADSDDGLSRTKKMTHDEAIKWAKNMIVRCRGHELPGGVNPEVTSHLFWEQSKPWKDLAEDHIEDVRATCKYFVYQVLDYAAPAEFRKPLEDLVVNDVLDEALKEAQKELAKLLADKARHPRPVNTPIR